MSNQSIYADPENFGLIELLYLARDAAATDLTTFITCLFAYLVVAYFVGKDLTRFQLLTVSGLYVLYMLFNLQAMYYQLLQIQEMNSVLVGSAPDAAPEVYMGLMLFTLLMSLAFMVETRIRNRGSKNESP